MLSADQQAEVMRVLKGSPLIVNWTKFESGYLPFLTLKEYATGEPVYRPGDAPFSLFILIAGEVVQIAEDEGREWFRRVIQPGDFFGQHALFSNEYRTSAQATSGARLLLMPASEVRVALEQNSTLRETLLREKLASRMRRIPLLRSLTDYDVRWLALVAQDMALPTGEPVPLSAKPGIWIIDRGQIAVRGPANPYPQRDRPWGLTSGNFFVAPRPDEAEARGRLMFDGLSYGVNCVADEAVARLGSQLIYLPHEHAARLIEGKPELAEMLSAPLDIVSVLASLSLFQRLSDEHLYDLAQITAWEFVPAGQNITTQGNVGHSFVILREGAAAIVAYDNEGRERPRNKIFSLDAYGETSLLEGKPRDATVRAVKGKTVNGADLLILDRRDLQFVFNQRPTLWNKEVDLVNRSVKEKTPLATLPWMQEGEILYWQGRSHGFWLAFPLLTVVIVFLVLLMLVSLAPSALQPMAQAGLLLSGLVLLLIAGIIVLNYFDDYYAVTNRRVVRRDRQIFIYESIQEARAEMIQDVTIDTDFWGRIFDFGDVTIRTASKQGAIRFDNARHPNAIKEFVEAGRTETSAAQRGRRREEMRRGLISGLQLALPIPERQRALGELKEAQTVRSRIRELFGSGSGAIPIPQSRSTRPILARWTRGLPEDVRNKILGPEKKTQPVSAGQIVWRKHWLRLVGRIWLPLLALISLVVAGLLALTVQLSGFGITPVQFMLVWLLLVGVTLARLWWVYTDWSNDLYVITDDRIIDIEMKPLSLKVNRREGGLDRVQNVTAEQKGFWAAVFGYGDVVITTAAANEGFTFNMVPKAKEVQAQIFQKVDVYRLRQEEKRMVERRQEITEGLEVYNQLRGSLEAPPEWRDA